MDDALDMDYFKRGPTWDGNSETGLIVSVGRDGISTTLYMGTLQTTTSHGRGPETSSAYDGSLEPSSVIQASPAPGGENIPTTILTSSSFAITASSPPATTTSTFTSIPTVTRMSLSPLSSTTSANTVETAAPGAYSGGGDSVKNKLAIALPIAIVGLLLILALIFFLLRQRRRTTRPPYEMTGNARGGLSSAALMNSPKIIIAPPIPAPANPPRIPIIDVTSTHDTHHQHHPTPGSASARSDDGSRTELGVAVAMPMDQRRSATEHDLREFSRPVSSVDRRVSDGPPSAGLVSVRMPFENGQSSDENDAVSILSGEQGREENEHDFDDMSSVSSFNDEREHPETEGHERAF